MMKHELEKQLDALEKKGVDRRHFFKLLAATGLIAGVNTGKANAFSSSAKGKIVIIGGGAAGISMAARLKHWLDEPDITLIDPSDRQFYQPGFTLIASGVYQPEDVWKKQEDCMPSGIKWIKDSVAAVDPVWNQVTTKSNGKIPYDFLGGKGIYTDTYTKHKCGGAPKKICLLSEHYARKQGTRDKLQLNYFTASKELYDIPYFTPRLLEIYNERNIPINLNVRVKGVDTSAKQVHFEKIETKGEEKIVTPFVEDYDFLHFTPPMSAPDFVRDAGLGWTEGKLAADAWVMVDKETLVHKKYQNIVSLGDVAGIPTSKTSAAIRKQVPIAAKNLIALMEGKEPTEKYNGYAACPIVTDYGHVLLCEFDYEKKPDISFPFSMIDTSKEQWLAWILKVYILKPMYFNGMLNGYA